MADTSESAAQSTTDTTGTADTAGTTGTLGPTSDAATQASFSLDSVNFRAGDETVAATSGAFPQVSTDRTAVPEDVLEEPMLPTPLRRREGPVQTVERTVLDFAMSESSGPATLPLDDKNLNDKKTVVGSTMGASEGITRGANTLENWTVPHTAILEDERAVHRPSPLGNSPPPSLAQLRPRVREKKRVSGLVEMGGEGLDRADPSPGVSSVPGPEFGVGVETGRWMAGELDASELSWSDDAAARRAVATRHAGAMTLDQAKDIAPADALLPPPCAGWTPSPANPVPRVASMAGVFGNWSTVAALVSAFLAVGVVTGVLFFSRALWPKLRLHSDPPGAHVLVDGTTVERGTPVAVQVAPDLRHRIVFRKEGYETEIREIAEGIGLGRTYTLKVAFTRLVPELHISPVPAKVMLNGREAGSGQRVPLKGFALGEQIEISVEADGYVPWKLRVDSAALLPSSIDVVLAKSPD